MKSAGASTIKTELPFFIRNGICNRTSAINGAKEMAKNERGTWYSFSDPVLREDVNSFGEGQKINFGFLAAIGRGIMTAHRHVICIDPQISRSALVTNIADTLLRLDFRAHSLVLTPLHMPGHWLLGYLDNRACNFGIFYPL